MPSKPLLSQSGVEDKLTVLYALGDVALAAQAELIRTDFMEWLADNFALTTDQEAYLSNMDTRFADFLSDTAYICVKYRLPFTFNPPMSPDISKRLDLNGSLSGSFQPVPEAPPVVDIGGNANVEGINPEGDES